jgi:soluble lytic murein transglycosylase-like protein
MRPTWKRTDRRKRTAPRSDLRSLARSRGVQALLVTTAVVQGAATYAGVRVQEADGGSSAIVQGAVREAVTLNLRPVVVSAPAAAAGELVAAHTAEALAEEYRAKGYEVPGPLARQIYAAAVRHRIQPEVAFGLVRTESEFRDYATSRVGAIGLTQLMPGTARWFQRNITIAQLRDSETNLEIGFRYLRELIDRYEGDLHLALTAYNRGTGTVDRVMQRGGDPDNGYSTLVMRGSR